MYGINMPPAGNSCSRRVVFTAPLLEPEHMDTETTVRHYDYDFYNNKNNKSTEPRRARSGWRKKRRDDTRALKQQGEEEGELSSKYTGGISPDHHQHQHQHHPRDYRHKLEWSRGPEQVTASYLPPTLHHQRLKRKKKTGDQRRREKKARERLERLRLEETQRHDAVSRQQHTLRIAADTVCGSQRVQSVIHVPSANRSACPRRNAFKKNVFGSYDNCTRTKGKSHNESTRYNNDLPTISNLHRAAADDDDSPSHDQYQAHRVFVPNVSLTANTRDSTTDNNIANGSAGSGSKEIGAYDHVNEEDIEWDEALFAQLDEYDDQDDDNTDHVSRQTASTKANIKTNTSNANGDLVLPELATMAIDTTTTPNFDS